MWVNIPECILISTPSHCCAHLVPCCCSYAQVCVTRSCARIAAHSSRNNQHARSPWSSSSPSHSINPKGLEGIGTMSKLSKLLHSCNLQLFNALKVRASPITLWRRVSTLKPRTKVCIETEINKIKDRTNEKAEERLCFSVKDELQFGIYLCAPPLILPLPLFL